jgi:hypothetical protein
MGDLALIRPKSSSPSWDPKSRLSKAAGLLAEQRSKPVHALAITLHQLIIEHYGSLQILRQREPIQSRQLCLRSNRQEGCGAGRAVYHNAFGVQPSPKLDGLVALLC